MDLDQLPKTAEALVHDPKNNTLRLEDLPVPQRTDNDTEHIIQVRAVALTNGELAWPEPATQDHPVPGYEMAGVVAVAPPESPFSRGTEVYARTGFGRPGSARSFSVATTAELGRKPSNITWEEAATVPLSALTAWQALFVHGGLAAPRSDEAPGTNAGKRVLVTAAAGGVGQWAVQLARLAGAHVVGTSGPGNVAFVRGLGADEALDYTAVDLVAWAAPAGRKFDLVVDCVGGRTLEQAWLAAAPGGTVVSVALPAALKRPAEGVAPGVRDVWFIVEENRRQLDEITRLLESGRTRAAYDSVFGLADYEAAFQKVSSGHVRGKVVLRIS